MPTPSRPGPDRTPTGPHAPAHAPAPVLPAGAARRGASPFTFGLATFLAVFTLYAMTAAPGACWQDSGVHQYRILSGKLDSPFGLALSHPLHYWLGRAALRLPLGEPARALNLMSALFGAVGVAAVAGLTLAITARRFAAAVAAATVALAHSYWQMSAVTETYTLAAALMTAEWCLLLAYARRGDPRLLCAIFAVNGLHVADHLLGLLTLVTYLGLLIERVVRRRVRPGWAAACLAAWVLTAAPYWALVLAHWRATGDLPATISSAFFGVGTAGGSYQQNVFNRILAWWVLRKTLLNFGYNFPNLTLAVALLGMLRMPPGALRLFRIVIAVQTLVIVGFVGRYSIADQYTFFVPICALAGLWCGLGVDQWLTLATAHATRAAITLALGLNALLPPAVYVAFPALARQRGWLRTSMRHILHRDEYSYFLRPWKFDDASAETFARDALARAGPDGWLIADATTAYAVAYVCLAKGGPPGVRVYHDDRCLNHAAPDVTADEIRRHLAAGGKIITVPYPRPEHHWADRFDLRKGGYFWRLALRGDDPRRE